MALFAEIADGAAAESPLWEAALRPRADREERVVFSALLPQERFALGLETIYEGYLVHYGRARLFDPPDDDVALLLGDALLAHGLVRVARTDSVAAIGDLSALLSLCAQLRAEGRPGDGTAWAATAARLASGGLDAAREALRERGDVGPLEAVARAAAGDAGLRQALDAHADLMR